MTQPVQLGGHPLGLNHALSVSRGPAGPVERPDPRAIQSLAVAFEMLIPAGKRHPPRNRLKSLVVPGASVQELDFHILDALVEDGLSLIPP